ncbi:MAG: phosphotransferase [Rhizobiaceae bacterium]|nr:phosphotransferase [Rhizobiaceae bacterium]
MSATSNEFARDDQAPSEFSASSESDSGQSYFRNSLEVLAIRPPSVEAGKLGDAFLRHYGLRGTIEVLSSEVEHTAEVVVPAGDHFILKTSPEPAALDSFRFQAAAMSALSNSTGFVVPQIRKTLDRTLTFEERGMCGYLQRKLEGKPPHQAAVSQDLLYRTGQALASLDSALGSLDLPGMHRPVLWNIQCWPQLRELEEYVVLSPVADLVRSAIHEYADSIEHRLHDVSWQVTHNDPSPYNMLATDHGIAFIDFGDGGWGPRIQDLAIAASHFVRDPGFALGGAEYLIAGYSSVLPLSRREAQLLVALVRARQSALVLINYWRSHLFPADAAYIMKNVARAEHGLSILAPLTTADAETAVLRAMNSAVR